MAKVEIKDRLSGQDWELMFTSAKSTGPGGQHVNTTESRVTMIWFFAQNPVLSTSAKDRLIMLAGSKVKADGSLQISSQVHRSKKQNQEECLKRLKKLIAEALTPPKRRKPTRVPRAKKEQRLKDKKIHSDKKNLRQKVKY